MVAKFFLVVGILIMVVSGGCSLLVLGDPYLGGMDGPVMVLIIGGIPFATGLAIALVARNFIREAADRRPD